MASLYKFTKRGLLVDRDTGQAVAQMNIKRKEEINMINEYVVGFIQKKLHLLGLTQVMIPFRAPEEDQIPIWMSRDLTSNPDKVLVLVCSRGEISCGQWSKTKCISHSLRVGSMLYAIQIGIQNGYAILIANPNQFCKSMDTPERHVLYLWDSFLAKLSAKNVFFWAHGYGGKCVMNLINERKIETKLRGVALVDSVSTAAKNGFWLKTHVRHWISSEKPLNEKILDPNPRTLIFSGGTEISAKINLLITETVFGFFKECMGEKLKEKVTLFVKEDKKDPLGEISYDISCDEEEDEE